MNSKNQRGSMLIVIVAVLALVVLGAAGGYWYMNKDKNKLTPVKTETVAEDKVASSLEKELNEIEITDFEEEFNDVDKDIAGL